MLSMDDQETEGIFLTLDFIEKHFMSFLFGSHLVWMLSLSKVMECILQIPPIQMRFKWVIESLLNLLLHLEWLKKVSFWLSSESRRVMHLTGNTHAGTGTFFLDSFFIILTWLECLFLYSTVERIQYQTIDSKTQHDWIFIFDQWRFWSLFGLLKQFFKWIMILYYLLLSLIRIGCL